MIMEHVNLLDVSFVALHVLDFICVLSVDEIRQKDSNVVGLLRVYALLPESGAILVREFFVAAVKWLP